MSERPHTPSRMSARRIAIMQPYFFPYAGYFRLLAHVDQFVILDCVQFPRTGRVHRSEVARNGKPSDWLTLPLARQHRSTLIHELAFATQARASLDERLASLPWFRTAHGPAAARVRSYLQGPMGSVVDFLQQGLELVARELGLSTPVCRSSSFAIPVDLRGQDRILAIARSAGASIYLNAPGGRDLYDPLVFRRAGIELEFLGDYSGEFIHLLPSLMQRDPADIARDIHPDSLARTQTIPAPTFVRSADQ